MLIQTKMSHIHISDQIIDAIDVTVLGDRLSLEALDMDANSIGSMTIDLDTFDSMVVEVKRQRGVE